MNSIIGPLWESHCASAELTRHFDKTEGVTIASSHKLGLIIFTGEKFSSQLQPPGIPFPQLGVECGGSSGHSQTGLGTAGKGKPQPEKLLSLKCV